MWLLKRPLRRSADRRHWQVLQPDARKEVETKMWLPFLLAVLGGVVGSPQPERSSEIREFVLQGFSPAYLGVYIRDVTTEDVKARGLEAERGVVVEDVEPGSPADTAGLKKGDIILEYAGRDVFSAQEFRRWVADTPVGREVSMAIWRDGSRHNVTVRIGERPGSGRGPTFGEGRRWFGLPEFSPGPWPRAVPGPEWFPQWREGRQEDRPRLGLLVAPLTKQMAEYLGVHEETGLLVLEVSEDSPAAKAGLQAGDVILRIDGRPAQSPEDLRRLNQGRIALEIWRKGEIQTVEVELEGNRAPEGSESMRL